MPPKKAAARGAPPKREKKGLNPSYVQEEDAFHAGRSKLSLRVDDEDDDEDDDDDLGEDGHGVFDLGEEEEVSCLAALLPSPLARSLPPGGRGGGGRWRRPHDSGDAEGEEGD